MHGVEITHLIGGHRERVNVALFRGVAFREVELLRVEQFRSHVPDNARFGWATWLHDCGIDYHTGDPEVSQQCGAIVGDQNFSLDRTNIGVRLELATHPVLTGLISLWTIPSECRYSRPQAACASYEDKSQTFFSMKIIGIAYQLESIDPLIFLDVIDDVSV